MLVTAFRRLCSTSPPPEREFHVIHIWYLCFHAAVPCTDWRLLQAHQLPPHKACTLRSKGKCPKAPYQCFAAAELAALFSSCQESRGDAASACCWAFSLSTFCTDCFVSW